MPTNHVYARNFGCPAVLGFNAVLLGACNIEALTQSFIDQHVRDTSTGGDSSSGSGTSDGEAPESSGSHGEAETEGHASGASEGTAGGSTGTPSGGSAGTTTGAMDTTGAASAVCGDQIVEGDEECDDPGDIHCFKCLLDRTVFVTSVDVHGDFSMSSLQHLTYWCNHLAAVAGLFTDNQPRYKPWVSTSEGSAAELLHHARGRYVMVNGLVFAESWDALVAGQILNPLNVDENGQIINGGVYTDTRPDGSAMPGTHCGDWQSDDLNTEVYRGYSSASDGSWTLYVGEASNPITCAYPAALYCFESP